MSMEEIHTSVKTTSPVLCEGHFAMARRQNEQPYLKSLSTMMLGLSATTLSCKKGIKLGSGECFFYGKRSEQENDKKNKMPEEKSPLNKMPQEKLPLYLYEAGLDLKQADTLSEVHIYVKRDREDRVLVGTLSAAHPLIPIELTLGEDCILTHDSKRRDVFFNGFCFTNRESVTFEAKELWVSEVLPSKEFNINPVDEGKEYHLLEVYSKRNTNANIRFHVRCNERTLLGELVAGCRTRLNSVFGDVISLSHTSNTSVFFSGYKVPSQPLIFELKELKTYEFEKLNLKSTPKESWDPEYQSYKNRLAKVPSGTSKQQPGAISKHSKVNMVTMPHKKRRSEETSGTSKQQPGAHSKESEVNMVTMSHKKRLSEEPSGTSKQQPGAHSKQSEMKMLTMLPRTAPLIFDNGASYKCFSGNSHAFFRAPKQELEDDKKRVVETLLKTPASKKKAKNATRSSQDLRFWGVIVKPGETRECDPGELYCHLSQIALEAGTTENVEVFVEIDDKSIMLGTFSADDDPHFVTYLVLKKKFKLRHSSKIRNICFTGYEFKIIDKSNASSNGGEESHEEVPSLIPPDSNTDGYMNNEATHGANKLTAPRPVDAPSSIPEATVEKPDSPGNPKGDDEARTDANASDGDDSESYEDVDSPQKVNKRPMETPLKTPQGKKAKIETDDGSDEEVPLRTPPDSNTDGYMNNEATHGANKLTASRPIDAPSSMPEATVEKPDSPGNPNGDDELVIENFSLRMLKNKLKKRPVGTPLEAPQGKKAKIETGEQALSASCARKSPERKHTTLICSACPRRFSSSKGLADHFKAKHG